MFERFTIDILAEHVATQLLEGEPTPKLAHRFFRKGRRDGKRALDHASVSKVLQDAVHLAGSTLVEGLASARRETELRIADLQAAIDAHAHLAAATESSESLPPTEPAAQERSGATAGGAADQRDSSQVLLEAQETRRRLKAQRIADAEAAETLARANARRDAREAAADAALAARAEIPKLRRHLDHLPAEYTQRFESIKHTGEILWARYCNGFVQGEARRGSRTSDVSSPSGSLVFETPDALKPGAGAPAASPSEPETSPNAGA